MTEYDHREVIRIFCKEWDKPEYKLMLASFYNNFEEIKELINEGADIRANKDRVLTDACNHNRLEIIRFLQPHYYKTIEGRLAWATKADKYPILRRLSL